MPHAQAEPLLQSFDDEATASSALHTIAAAPLHPEAFNVLVPAQFATGGSVS